MMPADAQPVLLITTLRDEMLPTVRRLRLATLDAVTFAGQVGRRAVVGRICGGGGPRMLTALEQTLATTTPSHLLLLGFAGALSPQLHAGDLMQPRWVFNSQQHAWRLSDGAPPVRTTRADADGAQTLLTMDQIVGTPADKLVLHREHHAAAVDMESFHVACLAAARGLPLTVLRAISDDADTTLPPGVEQWVNDDGSPRLGKALAALLRRPTMLGALLRLKKDSQRAADNMAIAVETWLATLP